VVASRNTQTALAIDIGGTKVAAGYVDSRGRILAEYRAPMSAHRRPQDGLQSVFDAVSGLQEKFPSVKPACIGIGVPGWVDPKRGVLIAAVNIPCWKNYPLARAISKHYRIRAVISNDANAAALAEAIWGAGKGHRNIIYVTLGTGIGTGFVCDGRIYTGWSGGAGEGGHVTIDSRGPLCVCGKRGCIEVYASGTGIARNAREQLAAKPHSTSRIIELAAGRLSNVSAEMVSEAAQEGDTLACQILEQTADCLAIWMGTVIDMIEPEVFIFGGGVGQLMMKYRGRIRQQLQKWAIAPRRKEVAIVEAKFGAQSALAGAAALCLALDGTPDSRRKKSRQGK
jgi:glucokinase